MVTLDCAGRNLTQKLCSFICALLQFFASMNENLVWGLQCRNGRNSATPRELFSFLLFRVIIDYLSKVSLVFGILYFLCAYHVFVSANVVLVPFLAEFTCVRADPRQALCEPITIVSACALRRTGEEKTRCWRMYFVTHEVFCQSWVSENVFSK